MLSNFGKPHQLIVAGERAGEMLCGCEGKPQDEPQKPESGSCIIVVATDAPLEHRQLRRLAVRATAGLSRTGSVFGHGCGDEVLAFTTAYAIEDNPSEAFREPVAFLNDTALDPEFFEATADATEQAVLKAIFSAESMTGFQGQRILSFADACRQKLERP